ncbi:MAG: helix-turn-helix domain-containing protein [Acidaminococcus provencensis]|jgi:excisionase family DNA binding protein|uniref:helix-turn-helix domain-containing protein n=1 Tax=Acidaminococcus provencensis TaxID=2058289 RepID=UPI0023F0B9D4|nr:helix-turn-helix domain-containing protein [Acidaminococcus provencensis]MCH4097441.1 helix-turn-helix domain-containing protein [Acidaminococcus provencensis]
MEKLVMKADEAAEVLNVGKSTVYDLCDRGILPRIKKLPGLRFRAQDVYALAKLKQNQEEYSPYQFRQLQTELANERARNQRIRSAALALLTAISEEGM